MSNSKNVEWGRIDSDRLQELILERNNEIYRETRLSPADVVIMSERLYNLCLSESKGEELREQLAGSVIIKKRMMLNPMVRLISIGTNLVLDTKTSSLDIKDEADEDVSREIYQGEIILDEVDSV